jgi:thioredoxin 2
MIVASSSIQLDARGLLVTCPQCGQRNRAVYRRLGQTFQCGKCHQPLPPISEPVEVQDDSVFEALTGQSALPVLVDFWAPWCGPCKMVAPEMNKVAGELTGRVLVAKVNTEAVPGLAQRFGIDAIPTLAVFSGGRELARQAGAMRAPGILQFIHRAVPL